jgi:hypothetical protein
MSAGLRAGPPAVQTRTLVVVEGVARGKGSGLWSIAVSKEGGRGTAGCLRSGVGVCMQRPATSGGGRP